MSNTASRKRPAAEIDIVEILDDSDDEDFHEIVPTCGQVPLERFLEMWHDVEIDNGWNTEAIENTGSFRKANSALSKEDTSKQAKAQYGRLMFKASSILFERVMGLKYFHTFLDIGHGVGNTVLQAAYTVGCVSLGIEVVSDRHKIALVYQEKMAELDDLINKKRDGKNYHKGPVFLRHGSLTSPEHYNFLTENIDVAFCNNYGGVFGELSKKPNQKYSLDDCIAGLFSKYKKGAVMVTLHPLPLGRPCREAVNAIRSRHKLAPSDEASFFDVEEYDLSGKGLLSWTEKPFVVYKYTKLGDSFLCINPNCPKFRNNDPIEASRKESGEEGDLILVNRCDCGVDLRPNYECPRHEIHVD